MKKDEVKVGSTYRVKVSGQVVPVRITDEKWNGEKHVGWVGTNTQTGRSVRVKSAQRLRSEAGATPDKPEPPTPAAAEPVPVPPVAAVAAQAATAANVGQTAGNGAVPLADYAKSPEAAANKATWDNIPDHGRADGTPTAKARRKALAKGVAAADQESARARDERAAAPDGMTASERAMALSAKKGSPAVRAAKAKKPPRAAKPAKAPKAEKPKRLSALDAAAKVLGEAKKPMNCKQIMAEILSKGLWKSPVGKTPEATLYAAVIREIAAKGRESRFKKHDKGLFVARKAG